jgi:hypothetical protein
MERITLDNLLCKLNIGHHRLAEANPDGTFYRHCVKCGKADSHSDRWSGRIARGDHRGDPNSGQFILSNPPDS